MIISIINIGEIPLSEFLRYRSAWNIFVIIKCIKYLTLMHDFAWFNILNCDNNGHRCTDGILIYSVIACLFISKFQWGRSRRFEWHLRQHNSWTYLTPNRLHVITRVNNNLFVNCVVFILIREICFGLVISMKTMVWYILVLVWTPQTLL